jgi:hypothetical protein
MCRFLYQHLKLGYRRSTAQRKLAPLAQSVERIHGKENRGLFSSSRDQQEQPFVQVKHIIAFGSTGSDWQRLASAGDRC